jgi:hypothetical protein
MRRLLAIILLCGGLVACLPVEPPPPPPPLPPQAAARELQHARQDCNATYPAQIGNYLPHANCVNAAVDRFALPGARYPDLVRLQEGARSRISARIDHGSISARTGETQMTTVDRAIDIAQRERDAANQKGADAELARVYALLEE